MCALTTSGTQPLCATCSLGAAVATVGAVSVAVFFSARERNVPLVAEPAGAAAIGCHPRHPGFVCAKPGPLPILAVCVCVLARPGFGSGGGGGGGGGGGLLPGAGARALAAGGPVVVLLFPIFRVILEPAVIFPIPILWRVDEVSAPVVLLTLLHAARVRVGVFVLVEVV